MNKTKSVPISKRMVWEAYLHIKRNKGAAGIDHQSIVDFEVKREDNLYKLWNRLASGSYFPPPVRQVEIPKKDGGRRLLGIPTVTDRIAQMVVTKQLSEQIDRLFDKDSYGYRPKKSALEAVGVARQRTWKQPWVIDLDIKGFFDHIDHDLLIKALKHYKVDHWALFYIERWLKAGQQDVQGVVVKPTRGTPQGGVISPLLANLFLHVVFDQWMRKQHPGIDFIRYADDILVHCKTQNQAKTCLASIKARMESCHLTLHPQKTKIVYAGLGINKQAYPWQSFDFLGFTFRKRLEYAAKKQQGFVGVSPAISNGAKKMIRQEIKSWRLHRRTSETLESIAKAINPIVSGWVNYYGKYYRSELTRQLYQIELYLRRWARRKFAKKTGLARQDRARQYLGRALKHRPELFVHWRYGMGSPIE